MKVFGVAPQFGIGSVDIIGVLCTDVAYRSTSQVEIGALLSYKLVSTFPWYVHLIRRGLCVLPLPHLKRGNEILIGLGGPNSSALVVTTDNDVLNLQISNTVLKGRKKVGVGVDNHVGNVTVDEDSKNVKQINKQWSGLAFTRMEIQLSRFRQIHSAVSATRSLVGAPFWISGLLAAINALSASLNWYIP
jgi:hypothetical protein